VVGGPLVGAAPCSTPASDLGSDAVSLNIPATATYTIWTRMKAPSTSANSVSLQVDTSSCFNVGGGSLVAANWVNDSTNWVQYHDGSTASPVTVSLSAGLHTFTYIGTQANVEVDRIIATTDTSCTPTGTGDNCQSGDSTPPTINLTAPANGAQATGPVTFQATASDASGIAKIEFLVDSTVVSTTANASSAQYSWSSSSVTNGAHSVSARATDTKNNVTTTPVVTVNVNNPQPCAANPSVPAGLHITASTANSVALAWSASTPAANCTLQGYKVYRDGIQVATPTGTSYTDVGLNPSTAYGYTIAANDTSSHTSTQSGKVTTTTPADSTAPTQPTGLSMSMRTPTSVSLAWNVSTDNVAVKEYVIYRNNSQVGISTTTAFTDTALTPSKTYSYTVKARDTAGNLSAASSALSATTLAGTRANFGDLDNNGQIGLSDLSIMLSHWGQGGALVTEGDVNGNGIVDLTDMSILLSNWGNN
jgi:chitodextrinase